MKQILKFFKNPIMICLEICKIRIAFISAIWLPFRVYEFLISTKKG